MPGCMVDESHMYTVVPEDTGVITTIDHARQIRDTDPRLRMRVVRRRDLIRAFVEFARTAGIEVKFGHKLETLEQSGKKVKVTFANGAQDTFDFVVGCDGLHSNTRTCLFGEQPADYTGLTQVRLSRCPPNHRNPDAFRLVGSLPCRRGSRARPSQ